MKARIVTLIHPNLENPAKIETTDLVPDVVLGVLIRHVLQNDQRENEVKMTARKALQVLRRIVDVATGFIVRIGILGCLDHGLGDVHASDLREVITQWLGKPADPTAIYFFRLVGGRVCVGRLQHLDRLDDLPPRRGTAEVAGSHSRAMRFAAAP